MMHRSVDFRMASRILLLLVWELFLLGRVASAQTRDQFATARQRMVEEFIIAEGVRDPRVLEVMRTVPRHLFIRAELRPLAYQDQALDIGHKQTISPPFIVAYMTETLDPQPTDRVLEIGSGSGYQAAVLSGLVQHVYTIEIVKPLGDKAADLLKRLKYDNVSVRVGDGYLGWPEEAPFDKIIVTCSPEAVPQPLVDQLKEGGRLLIPLGERYQQVFYLFVKKDGQLERTRLLPTLFVPMTGKMEELRERKPDPLNPMLNNAGFELDEDGDGLADGWHYQRRSQLISDAFAGQRALQFENSEPGRMAHMLQAMAVDGTGVVQLRVTWASKMKNLRPGPSPGQQPGIRLYFFSAERTPMDMVFVGPWLSDETTWTTHSALVNVPRGAREAIIQVGLNGGTGTLAVDEVQVSAIRR